MGNLNLARWGGKFEPKLSLLRNDYTFYHLMWRYQKEKSSPHIAQKKEDLGEVFKHNFGSVEEGGRNLNGPIFKILNGWGGGGGLHKKGGYPKEHVEALN